MIKYLSTKIPIQFLCRYFSVSRSRFYQWNDGAETHRQVEKKKICTAITKSFRESKKTYGSPRVFDDLIEWNFQVSENTVAKYMREMGLDARHKNKFRVMTTDSNHTSPIAPRLLKTESEETLPKRSGEVLAGDITYLKLGQKFIYLAVVMDIYTREIIGWSMSWSLETTVIMRAMDMAMKKVGPDAEIIFHSDRGSQYASEAYRNFFEK